MADVEEVDRWLDALADRTGSGEMPDAEAAALRAAVLREVDGAAEPTTQQTDQAWQRMAFRLRREGEVAPIARRRTWVASAVAAVFVLALSVNVFRQTQPTDAVQVLDETPSPVRGAVVVVTLTAEDPMARARTIAGAVGSLATSPTIYRHSEPLVLSLDISPEKLGPVQEALKKVDVPTDRIQAGPLRIEIAKRG